MAAEYGHPLSEAQGECAHCPRNRRAHSVISLYGDSVSVSRFQRVRREYAVKLIERRVCRFFGVFRPYDADGLGDPEGIGTIGRRKGVDQKIRAVLVPVKTV